jgi:hypothetical protein
VSTTVITVVLLQNCVDLQSGELGSESGTLPTSFEVGNEAIRVQVEGVAEVTTGEDHEPISLSTDPGVGLMSVDCVARFIDIQNCLSVSI